MHEYLTYKKLSASHIDYLDKISITYELANFAQASQSLDWVKDMSEKLASLEHNHTWDLVPKPSNRKVIGSRWVYKIKHKFNGDIERLRARLVAKVHT